jgi:hypothetical protein
MRAHREGLGAKRAAEPPGRRVGVETDAAEIDAEARFEDAPLGLGERRSPLPRRDPMFGVGVEFRLPSRRRRAVRHPDHLVGGGVRLALGEIAGRAPEPVPLQVDPHPWKYRHPAEVMAEAPEPAVAEGRHPRIERWRRRAGRDAVGRQGLSRVRHACGAVQRRALR